MVGLDRAVAVVLERAPRKPGPVEACLTVHPRVKEDGRDSELCELTLSTGRPIAAVEAPKGDNELFRLRWSNR